MTAQARARKFEPRSAPTTKVATSAMIASLAAEGHDTVSAPFGEAWCKPPSTMNGSSA